MNHPKLKHAIAGENVGSSIPWSPEAELRLRARIIADWFTMWVFFVVAAGDLVGAFLSRKNTWVFVIVGVFLFLCGIVNLYFLGRDRERLGEEMRRLPNGHWFEGSGMLANKPRSTANLTRWMVYSSDSEGFYCLGPADVGTKPEAPDICGRFHSWKKEAEWIPNHDPDQRADGTFPDIDPGGGRWVILCPCGVGHYKLRG